MGIFGKTAAQDDAVNADITSIKGPEDRDKTGPLPVVNDLVAMGARLLAERDRVLEGDNGCCVVVCSTDAVQGWSVEQAIDETARRFANSLRAYDSVFLHGRDKILVCLPFVKREDTTSVMERLRDLANRMPVDLPGGTSGHITISVGGIMMDKSMDVQQTINRADKAMEQGRISGNRTCMWTSDML